MLGRTMGVRLHPQGYCYLHWFNAINLSCMREVFSISNVSLRFGQYPLIRSVLGYLYAEIRRDLFLPSVYPASMGLYHINLSSSCVKLSTLIQLFIFSNDRIGGEDKNFNDVCMKKNIDIRRISGLMQAAGVKMRDAYPEAALRVLREEFGTNGTLLRDVLLDYQPIHETDRRKQFYIPYDLITVEIASLQSDYPELNVIVKPQVRHPHGYAAAARLCAEKFILDLIDYKKIQFHFLAVMMLMLSMLEQTTRDTSGMIVLIYIVVFLLLT